MPNRIVLVVEDDPNDETLTLRAIKQSGVPCTVVVARTAKEALEFLGRKGSHEGRQTPNPRVAFVDNTIPGSNGSDLVSNIRQFTECSNMPIVVLSGSSDQRVIEQCQKAGANSFLEKPLEMSDYVDQVGTAARYWISLNLTP